MEDQETYFGSIHNNGGSFRDSVLGEANSGYSCRCLLLRRWVKAVNLLKTLKNSTRCLHKAAMVWDILHNIGSVRYHE